MITAASDDRRYLILLWHLLFIHFNPLRVGGVAVESFYIIFAIEKNMK